jgi:glycosyltransferase involved in cell wall biosynthesis
VRAPSPEVSVVLPVYNEGESAAPVLERLAAAIKTPHEIVVVYDFDEDTTVPVIERLAAGLPHYLHWYFVSLRARLPGRHHRAADGETLPADDGPD